MKTILKLSLIAAVVAVTFTMYNINQKPGLAAPVITVKIDVGRKSRNCTGFGVCSVTIGVELARNGNTGGITGIGELGNNEFRVRLPRKLGNEKETTPTSIATEEPISLKAQGRQFTILPGPHRIDRGRQADTIIFRIK
ncbi:MAG: hypothetical protein JST84_04975 [Acidobacteria bacterium]|nr:hypothetical protein [Acidobacteriota bacterium]